MLCLPVIITKTVYGGHTTLKEFSIYLHTNKRHLVTKRNTNEVKKLNKNPYCIARPFWSQVCWRFYSIRKPWLRNLTYRNANTRLFQACNYLMCIKLGLVGRICVLCHWESITPVSMAYKRMMGYRTVHTICNMFKLTLICNEVEVQWDLLLIVLLILNICCRSFNFWPGLVWGFQR